MKLTNSLEMLSYRMPEIPEEEYRKAEVVINALKAVSRITFQNLYVIDYYKRNFLYVSDNPLFLCGHTAQEVKEMGYDFYLKHVSDDDRAMLEEINRAGFDFYRQLPAGEILGHTISYDFHILDEKQNEILVNHKLSPLLLTADGKIWLAVCAVTPSTHNGAGHVIVYKTGQPVYRKYSLENHRWEEKQRIILNEREEDIVLLTAQGHTMDEIAGKLYLTPQTIRYHKKELFKKLKVGNMMEAMLFAENYRLL